MAFGQAVIASKRTTPGNPYCGGGAPATDSSIPTPAVLGWGGVGLWESDRIMLPIFRSSIASSNLNGTSLPVWGGQQCHLVTPILALEE